MTTPGSTTDRGYGSEHQKERARLKPIVDAGEAFCAEVICLMRTRWIRPGTPWDLAHSPDRSDYRGPAHAKCNRAEGARRGNRMRRRKAAVNNGQKLTATWSTSRQW